MIRHGDQGSQHASLGFGGRCRGEAEPNGVRPSMGSVGDACDNAMRESVAATSEREPLARQRFASQAEAGQLQLHFLGWPRLSGAPGW